MKLPKKVLIEGKEWGVERKWRIVDGGVECEGLCTPEDRKLFVLHGLEEHESDYTFIHEFIHAVLNEKGFYLFGISTEVEELICHGIAKELLNNFKLSTKTRRSK